MAPAAGEVEIESISPYGIARSTVAITEKPLDAEELRKTDAFFQASLYLCLGMLYLKKNPLLKEPLSVDHLKARLLGHWGSDAGQAFTWIHFNRMIKKYNLNALFVSAQVMELPLFFRRHILRVPTLKYTPTNPKTKRECKDSLSNSHSQVVLDLTQLPKLQAVSTRVAN